MIVHGTINGTLDIGGVDVDVGVDGDGDDNVERETARALTPIFFLKKKWHSHEILSLSINVKASWIVEEIVRIRHDSVSIIMGKSWMPKTKNGFWSVVKISTPQHGLISMSLELLRGCWPKRYITFFNLQKNWTLVVN